MHGWCDAKPTVSSTAAVLLGANVCEQLAYGCYLKVEWPRLEPATIESHFLDCNAITTMPARRREPKCLMWAECVLLWTGNACEMHRETGELRWYGGTEGESVLRARPTERTQSHCSQPRRRILLSRFSCLCIYLFTYLCIPSFVLTLIHSRTHSLSHSGTYLLTYLFL